MTTVTGTIQFLENLGQFYSAFFVHLKNRSTKRHTIEEAHEMVKGVSAYIKSTVLSVQEIRNSNKAINGPQGTVPSKTAKSVHLVEKGLNKLRLNVAEVNPTYKIEPEVCLTLQVESQHAVSHFKHPSCTVLEYSRDLGNTMHESLKRTSQWSAYNTLLTDAHIIRYLRTESPSETFRKCRHCLRRKSLKRIKR